MLYQIVSNVADKTELFIEDEMTVGEVGVLVSEMVGSDGSEKIPRLTFQGHVLEDETESWSSVVKRYPLRENAPRKLFVHISDRQKTGAASLETMRAALPFLSRGEDKKAARAHARLMEPMIDVMVQNPNLVDLMISAQPQVKRMLKDFPEMNSLFRDPQMLKSVIMSQLDPEQERLMSRSLHLQQAQLSSIPGAEELLSRYANSYLRDAERDLDLIGHSSYSVVDEAQARPDPTKTMNSEALPNPWEQQAPPVDSSVRWNGTSAEIMNAFEGSLSNGGGSGGLPGDHMPFLSPLNGASAVDPVGQPNAMSSFFPWMMSQAEAGNPQIPNFAQGNDVVTDGIVPDSTRWSFQIAILKDMGFEDEALCIEALRATDGDVDSAVSFIMDKKS